MYGYCPKCGADVTGRERRINGNDTCATGHVYPSVETLNRKPTTFDIPDAEKGITVKTESLRVYRIDGAPVVSVENGKITVLVVTGRKFETTPDWAESFGKVMIQAATDARGQ